MKEKKERTQKEILEELHSLLSLYMPEADVNQSMDLIQEVGETIYKQARELLINNNEKKKGNTI